MHRLAPLLLLSAAAAGQDRSPMPLFSFGVLADVQYADQPTRGKRHYRASLPSLRRCVDDLNRRDLRFVVQLGDLVDAGPASFDAVLPPWHELRARRFHVLGNHDFPLPRRAVLEKLGLERGYYDFRVGERWRFVVTDGMDVSLLGYPKEHPTRKAALAMLQGLKERKAKNAQVWNGGIGAAQLQWLAGLLAEATKQRERVVLFCHFPLCAAAASPNHLLWNHAEVRALLERSPCVAAWFNGHDHAGGYAEVKGIHHVTFRGMVEAPERNAYGVVDVFESRLVLHGVGAQPSRELALRPW